MTELIIWTYDWVPDGPRGFVRDLRLRWACEEAGLAYSVRTVPFEGRQADHLARQPFGQVPFLTDGDLEIFESGAGLLQLARKSETLMPRDSVGEAQTTQWIFAALNSIEMVSVPWWFLEISGAKDNGLAEWLKMRLGQLEKILSEREWLAADRFTVADLLMADVLRVAKLRACGHRPASEAYVTRVTSRAAFKKAHADQLAHFAAADQRRAQAERRMSSSGLPMKMTAAAREFWNEFKATRADDVDASFFEVCIFGDNEESADHLADLVVRGVKRATAGLVWSYEAANMPVPKPGDLSIVTMWDGRPRCIIETTRVEITSFAAVTEEFAAVEGEGDGSLRYWREVHAAYYERECARIGRTTSDSMPIACERFRVVYGTEGR